MLTLLALMLQTATLDADTAKAAMTCAQALTITGAATESPMRLTSQFTHLAMQAAKAEGSKTPFFERLQSLSEEAGKGATQSAETAAALVPLCDRRFPLARSKAPARLPADSFRRDVLCFGTFSLLQGAAEEVRADDGGAALAKINAALTPLSDRMTDAELKKRGLATDQAFLKTMSDEMLASVAFGNPLAVAAACGLTGI